MRYFVRYGSQNSLGWPVCDNNLSAINGQVVCRAVSRADAENVRDALNIMVSKFTSNNSVNKEIAALLLDRAEKIIENGVALPAANELRDWAHQLLAYREPL